MDSKKYDELRKKINTKDFEGNNKGLDKWLFIFSFMGNISSIFFAYFLVYPALLKAISLNFISGNWGLALAFGLTIIFLGIFEVIKRYLIKNFSNDFITNKQKLNVKILGWFFTSGLIIALSFYLSISGSKNLGSTSSKDNNIIQTEIGTQIDSLTSVYDTYKSVYVEDNNKLRQINNDLRETLTATPLNYMTARKDYQESIDKNIEVIEANNAQINKLDAELNNKIRDHENRLNESKSGNEKEENKVIILFIVIVIINETLIIGGLYFREYYEYTLYLINQQKYEKIYLKKDRYKALLTFVYSNGKLTTGDKVITGADLKNIVTDKTNIQNPKKFVDEFLLDMDTMGVFTSNSRRRYIQATFDDALDMVDNYDDVFQVLENLK